SLSSSIYNSVISHDLGFMGIIELEDSFMYIHSGKIMRKESMRFLSQIYLSDTKAEDFLGEIGEMPDCLKSFVDRMIQHSHIRKRIAFLEEYINNPDSNNEETKNYERELLEMNNNKENVMKEHINKFLIYLYELFLPHIRKSKVI